MARWDPGTEERLRAAALALFDEHGYDNVTVTQIAERAGITRRTYFRYFPDKREVLFGGSELLPPAVAEAVLAADAGLTPFAAALAAFAHVGTMLQTERGDTAEVRSAVIASSAELRERERTKATAVTAALEGALRQRGADDATATAVAQLATLAFGNAWATAVRDGLRADFPHYLDAAAAALRSALTG